MKQTKKTESNQTCYLKVLANWNNVALFLKYNNSTGPGKDNVTASSTTLWPTKVVSFDK